MIYYSKDGKDYRARSIEDTDPLNPRKEYENLSHMCFYHTRYFLGDLERPDAEDVLNVMRDIIMEKEGLDESVLEDMSFKDLVDYIKENVNDVYLKVVYMYDHSGITIGTTITWPDHQWDGSTIGIVYVKKDEIIENTDAKEGNWLAKAEEVIENEIEEYDLYLRGECYGIAIDEKKTYKEVGGDNVLEDWEEIDSCYGFITDKYGEDLELYMLESIFGKPEKYTYKEGF